MTAVIAVQGLLFQDGGLVVMGANILNMGLLTAAVGYGLYRSAIGSSGQTRLAVAGVAAWLSVMTGALATSLQLWLSGTANLQVVVPSCWCPCVDRTGRGVDHRRRVEFHPPHAT